MPHTATRTGARALVDALRIHGTDLAFCVPGESYLAVLDALYDTPEIRLITCRQEGGAAYMAEAYGKSTGRPGICFVTRGPGATNASVGLHTAYQDSTPMILFIGQVARDQFEREAFQELDYRRVFGTMAKWVAQIDDAERIPEFVARAYATATSGRPGPVVLALPEDMLGDPCSTPDAAPYQRVRAAPGAHDLAAMAGLLSAARRPLVIVGGGDWDADACHAITRFAERWQLPVAASFRCQDIVDNTHGCYVGELGTSMSPALGRRVAAADLVLAIGARLGEMTTQGYTLLTPPVPSQRLVHVYPDCAELGRVYQPTLAINAGSAPFAHAAEALTPPETPAWIDWTAAARRDYLDNLEPTPVPGPLDLAAVMATLRERLPADTILTNGAGNYTGWPQRYWRYRPYRTQLAPTNGSMGYGLPAAIAACAAHPGRQVVAFAGDGCFLMNGQELATAVQHGLAPLVLVINNGIYGTIRMHQEREFPQRVIATDIAGPDFAAFACALGAHGERVERTEEFAPALERALERGRAALIELRIDPEVLSTRTTLSAVRNAALARRLPTPENQP